MAEAVGVSECTRKNTSWLSHRSFSKYTGPPFIATAIFAIFAQGNSPNFATAKQKTNGKSNLNGHFYYCLVMGVLKGGGGGGGKRVVDQVRRGVHGPGISVLELPLTDNSGGTKLKLHALRFLQHKNL